MRAIRKRSSEGFTLIELVAVLAIIALFGAVAVPTILHYRSRRSRDLDNGALVLRATLRAARQYAIQNRVQAGVVFGLDRFDPNLIRRYHIEYEENGVWAEPLGIAGKETVLQQNLSLELDTTWSEVGADELPGYVFDPTGMLVNPSALKAVIKIQDNAREVPGIRIEILRPTGRVRIKG